MDLANRGPLGPRPAKLTPEEKAAAKKARRKAVKRVSEKRKAYLASDAGAEGLAHMMRVKMLPCVICHKPGPSDAHHCQSNDHVRSDKDTIPLCKNHHQGPEGYHTQKRTWHRLYGPDTDYLPVVKDMLAGQWNPT